MAIEFNPMNPLFTKPTQDMKTVFYKALFEKASPLQEYAKGGKDARFQVTLAPTYLKNLEKRKEVYRWGRPVVHSEILNFMNNNANYFSIAYATLTMMELARDAGDREDIPIRTAVIKNVFAEKLDPMFTRFDIFKSNQFYNSVIVSRCRKYFLFGHSAKQTVADEFKLGYRMKDNLNIAII